MVVAVDRIAVAVVAVVGVQIVEEQTVDVVVQRIVAEEQIVESKIAAVVEAHYAEVQMEPEIAVGNRTVAWYHNASEKQDCYPGELAQ